MILLAVAVSAVSALAFSARKIPTYEATAKVFIGPRSVGSGDVSGALEELTFSREFITSYAQLLQSQPVAQKVIEKENIPRSAADVADSIEARVIPDTRIIEVKYTDTNALRAQKATNALVDVFVNEEVANLGSGQAVGARLLEPAQLPLEPVSPKPFRDTVLGLVLGLALGVGMAFLLQQLDTTLRTREDAEEALAPLPVLAGIPKAEGNKDRILFFENDARSPASEAVRTLRTNIQFFSIDNPIRLLLITSPYAEDGKTTVAANLGAAIAASGVKTLLVEADLRRPALREYFDYFEPERRGGLTDVLAGIDRIKDVVRDTHISNLLFLPAGSLPPNPSELLGSHKMEEVLNEVRDMADVVILDTPPALAVADSLVLGAHADGVALVIRAGVTHRERAREAKEAFERAGIRLLGMVLNDLDMSDAQYYYRYYQRYTPRHRQEKQLPAKVTRPSAAAITASGLDPSPPPKALQDATDQAAAAEELRDEVPEEKVIEAPDASLEEVLEEVEEAVTSEAATSEAPISDEEGSSLARLKILSRLMEDEDLLSKVSAAELVNDAPTFELEDPPELPQEQEQESDLQAAATVEQQVESEREPEMEIFSEPEPEAEMEIEREPEPETAAASDPITPLFPPESDAPAPTPSQPALTNGPQAPPTTLDPEVLRMMREEEDEYEEENDFAWVGERGEDDTEDDEESADDSVDLEALGIDVTHLTPKQRKRLRKRIHRLGPEAATQDLS